MATINENEHSGEGDEKGQLGFFASREFDVILRDVGDDKNRPLVALEAEVPLGSQHPDPDFSGLFAAQYRKPIREEGTLDFWKCVIIYLPRLSFTTAGWDVRFQSSVESRQTTHDINGRRIGGNSYRLPKKLPDGTTEAKTHTAETLDGPVGVVQVLYTTPEGKTKQVVMPQPVEVFRPVSSMTMGKQIPDSQLNIGQIQVAGGWTTFVNSRPLPQLGLAARHMMYMGGTLEKIASQGEADTASQVSWDVTLEFSINYATVIDDNGSEVVGGWVKHQLFDWYDHKGRRGDVHVGEIGGAVQRSTWDLYPQIEFQSLFAVFGDLRIFNAGPLVSLP